MEVENSIAKILLSQPANGAKADSTLIMKYIAGDIFTGQPAEEFALLKENYIVMSEDVPGVASLSNTIVRRAIYTAALSDDETVLQTIVGNIAELNADIVLAALDCIRIAWKNRSSLKSLSGVSMAYISLLNASENPEVCAYICYELADVLERAFVPIDASGTQDNGDLAVPNLDLHDAIRELGSLLRQDDSPYFSNARIRMSGFLLIDKIESSGQYHVPKEAYRSRIEAWGRLLWEAGNASNVCAHTKYICILQH